MNIQRLYWKNYRNLREGEIDPCATVNVIYGKNAQGKTNLLESMWLLTGGRSFRGSRDVELTAGGEPAADLRYEFLSGGREQKAQIRISEGHRSAVLNGIPKRSCAELIGTFCAVIFSPEHISLVSGAPVLRRNFIDSALCQLRPGYAGVLSGYNRALSQRNALLKDIPRHSELLETLDVWDTRLISLGEKVVRARREYLDLLRGPAQSLYSGISSNMEKLELQYLTSENFPAALAECRRNDILLGHTGAGPHRDDIAIRIDSMDARSYASQGQKRSAVLALKLAEAELLDRANEEKPVVFLDDVLSELDSGRQDYLLNHLGSYQVFITCCEPQAVSGLKNGKLFHVVSGGVSPQPGRHEKLSRRNEQKG